MEYLRVKARQEKIQRFINVDVLINKQRNGSVGKLIQLEKGIVEVSVDCQTAIPQRIVLENTTINNPAELTIIC